MADINFSEFMSETKRNQKTVEMPDGQILNLPPLELAPDTFFECAKKEDHKGMATALLGEDGYKIWTSFGANALALLTLYAKMYGVTLPNSLPS